MTTRQAVAAVRKYLGEYPTGMCYVAAEAVKHLSKETLYPQVMHLGSFTHWYLLTKRGNIVDPTVHQFTYVPKYNGRGCGFLTIKPSRGAQLIIDSIR